MTGAQALSAVSGAADELDDGSRAVGLLLSLRALLLLLSECRDWWMVEPRSLEDLAARCSDEAGSLLALSGRLGEAGRALSSSARSRPGA